MSKPFQNILNWVAKHFKDDPAKMLICTGVVGWTISSLAQIFSIMANSKIAPEQKSFLIPQEMYDAVTNISLYFLITLFTKKTVAKLFQTGKWAPKNVRAFLNKNADLYSKKVGKVDFNLGDVLEKKAPKEFEEYKITKGFGTTAATVGAGILATNVITPLVRNKMASRIQKSIINMNQEFDSEIETEKQDNKPKQQVFKANPYYTVNKGSLKI